MLVEIARNVDKFVVSVIESGRIILALETTNVKINEDAIEESENLLVLEAYMIKLTKDGVVEVYSI